MLNTFTQNSLGLAVAFICASGCSHRQSQPQAHFAALPHATGPVAAQPTSDRNANRIYETQSSRQPFQPAYAAPEGTDAAQWSLAEQIRELLISDRTLAPYPGDITVAIDAKTNGLVHVSGNIINTYERRKLRAQLEQLPGVIQVDDQSVVGLQGPGGGAANLGK